MNLGLIGDIIDGLHIVEDVRMEFSDDRDAVEFCRENDIPTSEIQYDSNGDVYINDVDTLIKRRDMKNTLGIPSTDISRGKKKKNSYSYKGLESYTDTQIRRFEVKKAIYKDSKGTYHIDWDLVNWH